MSLIGLILFVLVVAVILWLCDQLPVDARAKQIIRFIVVIVALLYVVEALGFFAGPTFRFR